MTRIAECLVLDAQRLRLGDRIADHVALRDASELLNPRPFGGHRSVCVEGKVGGQGVGHEGSAFSGDDGDSLLQGRQPVDEVAGDGAVLQRSQGCDEILVITTTAVCGASGDRQVRFLGNPGGQVDVVCREVLDDTNVGYPTWERSLAPRGDLEDLAEITCGETLARRLKRRVVALDVSDGAHEPGGLKRLDDTLSPTSRRAPLASRSERERRRPQDAMRSLRACAVGAATVQ